jgi:hypothetical protein
MTTLREYRIIWRVKIHDEVRRGGIYIETISDVVPSIGDDIARSGLIGFAMPILLVTELLNVSRPFSSREASFSLYCRLVAEKHRSLFRRRGFR